VSCWTGSWKGALETDADGPGEDRGDPFPVLARRVLNESVRKG
jgi:hypothetical protein